MNYTGGYPIFRPPSGGQVTMPDPGPGPYLPVWETSPVLKRNIFNLNIFGDSQSGPDAKLCWETGEVVFGEWVLPPAGGVDHPDLRTSQYASLLSVKEENQINYNGDPISSMFLPVFDSFDGDRKTVGVLLATISWAHFFLDIFHHNVQGVTLILENTCNGAYTYEINGEEVIPVGPGDLHDTEFNRLGQSAEFDDEQNISDGTRAGLRLNQSRCKYSAHVYPSERFADNYKTNTPVLITVAVAFVFVFTVLVFFIYDRLVEKRQSIILQKATQTSAIVSSLFPENVRDRLMNTDTDKAGHGMASNHRLKSYLSGDADATGNNSLDLAPIADLVPHATVLFADISGFTAWSSTREPAQVFILLQNVYQAFDIIAKRRRVFKVETIGDSYVAVTGLPEPQAKHAVIMAKFAGESLLKMNQVTRDLEVVLGPDTGDLTMRVGLHSGPVTAGVLRGERARFQLFGDTVNTAARMER
jgi:class 3 adenylate cyclase